MDPNQRTLVHSASCRSWLTVDRRGLLFGDPQRGRVVTETPGFRDDFARDADDNKQAGGRREGMYTVVKKMMHERQRAGILGGRPDKGRLLRSLPPALPTRLGTTAETQSR